MQRNSKNEEKQEEEKQLKRHIQNNDSESDICNSATERTETSEIYQTQTT